MADEFVMPKLGLTMEAGTIVGWLVDDGAEVEAGQPVLVIETDKVESEVEATKAGRVHRVGLVGQEYPCGAQIGWFLDAGETPPAEPASTPPGATAGATAAVASTGPTPTTSAAAGVAPAVTHRSATARVLATTGLGGRLLASPNAKRLAAERGIDLWAIAGTGPGGRITSEDVPAEAQPVSPVPTTAAMPAPTSPTAASSPGAVPGAARPRALATAAGHHLADLLGIDVAQVAPAGLDPRVTKDDVAAHVRALLATLSPGPAPAASPSPSSSPSPSPVALPPPLQEPSSIVPLTGMRGTIAERMSHSLHSMAQLTLTMDVDMDGVVVDRTVRKASAADGDPVPGYTDYVIAATAAALVEHRALNSQIIDSGLALLPEVNVGLAVAIDGGLIVPVIHNTPSLSLEELAAETSRLAEAARQGKLKLPDLEGGTFSVTALGMFDVDGFTPIINAPNTAILGVGRLRDNVAWTDDHQPVKASRLTLSLTWDHRAVDGAPAAEFARSIKTNLEAYRR